MILGSSVSISGHFRVQKPLALGSVSFYAQSLLGAQRQQNHRILYSGSKAPEKGDSRNQGLQPPDVYVLFGPPFTLAPVWLWGSLSSEVPALQSRQAAVEEELCPLLGAEGARATGAAGTKACAEGVSPDRHDPARALTEGLLKLWEKIPRWWIEFSDSDLIRLAR